MGTHSLVEDKRHIMYKFIVISLAFLLSISATLAQDKPAYMLYDNKGKKAKYEKLIKTLNDADIVLFGELHDNPIAHWLQHELVKDANQKRELILGAEMVETDNQNELNQYLKGEINYEQLDSVTRLWINYKTDYAPLVDFAKDNGIAFVASNVPRRFASEVYKGGFEALDSLSDEEKAWIAPLPIDFDSNLPTYLNILEMMGEHGSPLLVKAQAIKDATMAHSILTNYIEGKLFIHFNGAFHSDYREGILWYLMRQKPDLKYVTISTVSQANVQKLEKDHKGKADFIICVDEDMTSTY